MNQQIKPRLSFMQLCNMSIGFFGIQFGFALQTTNVSRIFSTLGAEISSLAILWLAAPITGLLVQPVIGYLSDNTWHPKWGRRRPFFFIGAVLAAITMFLMPNSNELWMAVFVLWVMDASINISMEPLRAFVGDKLDSTQQTSGFAMQTFFIGCGGVIASLLPTIFTDILGFSNESINGGIPETVRYSFYVGGVVYFIAVMWTVIFSSEDPPADMAKFEAEKASNKGLLKAIKEILSGFLKMPKTMVQLSYVQFFSWTAFFAFWVYTIPAIANMVFGTTDAKSLAFQDAGNWFGIMSAVYGGVSAIAAFILPYLAKKTNRKIVHLLCLVIGGLSLISIYFISNKNTLLFPMVGLGIAWASILTMPYAILAGSLPANKMGYYMGIFNFFIVIPQIIAGVVLGAMLSYFFSNQAIMIIIVAGVSLIISGFLTLFVQDINDFDKSQ